MNNGFVPVSRITGRAYAIIWPIKNIGIISSQDPIK
jgi:signal peptidase I